jgi:hypothetical protein
MLHIYLEYINGLLGPGLNSNNNSRVSIYTNEKQKQEKLLLFCFVLDDWTYKLVNTTHHQIV